MDIFFKYAKQRLKAHIKKLQSLRPLPKNWKWHPESIDLLLKFDKKILIDIDKLHKQYSDDIRIYSPLIMEIESLRSDLLSLKSKDHPTKQDQLREKTGVDELLKNLSKHLAVFQANLGTKIKSFLLNNDGNRAVCIPGCYICCLTIKSGAEVSKEEAEKVRNALSKHNTAYNTNLRLDSYMPKQIREGNEKRYNDSSSYCLPSESIPEKQSLNFTSFVNNWNSQRTLLRCRLLHKVSEEEWNFLYSIFRSAYPKIRGLHPPLFKPEFEGKICSFYQDRPKVCKKWGCNYATKYFPRAIKKSDGKVIIELLNEPILIRRFGVINRYL